MAAAQNKLLGACEHLVGIINLPRVMAYRGWKSENFLFTCNRSFRPAVREPWDRLYGSHKQRGIPAKQIKKNTPCFHTTSSMCVKLRLTYSRADLNTIHFINSFFRVFPLKLFVSTVHEWEQCWEQLTNPMNSMTNNVFRQGTDRKGKRPDRCRSSLGTWAPNWSCDLQAPGYAQRVGPRTGFPGNG